MFETNTAYKLNATPANNPMLTNGPRLRIAIDTSNWNNINVIVKILGFGRTNFVMNHFAGLNQAPFAKLPKNSSPFLNV